MDIYAIIAIPLSMFFLGIWAGVAIQGRETKRMTAMWQRNRQLMQAHFKQCLGVKPLLLLILTLID